MTFAQPGNVSLVGHSLGGGMASAASGAGGIPAQTFNAAGLSRATLDDLPYKRRSLVQSTHVRGDILSGLQDLTPGTPNAYGTRRGLDPARSLTWGDVKAGALGARVAGPIGAGAAALGARGVRLHSMDSVMAALDAEREDIEDRRQREGCDG